MRQSLLETFHQIHIFDLQGEAGQGSDENVFFITKGVAIAILVRNPSLPKVAKYYSIRGKKLDKYKAAAHSGLADIAWIELAPSSPNYFLVPRNEAGREEYDSFWSIDHMFIKRSTGVLTGRDRLAIANTKSELREQLDKLISTSSDRDIANAFGLQEVGHWSLSEARNRLREEGVRQDLIRPIAYRPFDVRFYYDHDALVFRRRDQIMRFMVEHALGIAVCRLTKGGEWCHGAIAEDATDDSYISDKSKERGYLFPIYLQQEPGIRPENLSRNFRSFIDAHYDHHYTPEEILGYIYAVLYAPAYRARYAEFLRIDFPHLPFPAKASDFELLSEFGWELVQAHLLRELPHQGIAKYHGKGDHSVEAIRYAEEEAAVWINKTQCFKPVPEDVWTFRIGGYQVLDKYLKSRKGRTLTLNEINHVSTVADSLAFTVGQIKKIDAAYRAIFPNGDKPTTRG